MKQNRMEYKISECITSIKSRASRILLLVY